MQLQPYVFFYGRCQEALDFYKSVFGGAYEVMRVGDSPMKEHMPPGSDNLVMHASFKADGLSLLCADGPVKALVDLAVEPEHRRGHGALYDALNNGRMDLVRLRRALAGVPLPRAADSPDQMISCRRISAPVASPTVCTKRTGSSIFHAT